MKHNDLVSNLYALSAFARHDYPKKDILADAILSVARDAKKMSMEVAAYKMAVKSLEAKLADARERARGTQAEWRGQNKTSIL